MSIYLEYPSIEDYPVYTPMTQEEIQNSAAL
jgi:hypothetical protein